MSNISEAPLQVQSSVPPKLIINKVQINAIIRTNRKYCILYKKPVTMLNMYCTMFFPICIVKAKYKL